MNTVNVCHACYSQDNNTAQGRQKHCCSLVYICLEVSWSQRRVMLDSICLSALSHLFLLAIYFVIMFSSFSADYITESHFYSDNFCLTLILTVNLSFGTSNENLEEGTVLFMKHTFLWIRSPLHSSKSPQITYCAYIRGYKTVQAIFSEFMLAFHEHILQSFGIMQVTFGWFVLDVY